MNRILKFTFLVISYFGLVACETLEGVGQDIQVAGSAVSETANDVQDDL